jgi:hypothetical protein
VPAYRVFRLCSTVHGTPSPLRSRGRTAAAPTGWLLTRPALDGILDLYRPAWRFADATIEELPLDVVGRVPWWRDSTPVTLERVMVHVISGLARHVGHADILR